MIVHLSGVYAVECIHLDAFMQIYIHAQQLKYLVQNVAQNCKVISW